MLTLQQREDFDVFEDQSEKDAMRDLRLEMKVKNNILWKKIHEKHPSVAAFCRANEEAGIINQVAVGRLLAFKISPFTNKRVGGKSQKRIFVREYRKLCLALERALGVPAEVLFPEELYQKFVGTKTSKAVEISSFGSLPAPERQKLLFLPAPDPSPVSEAQREELREKIDGVFRTLTYREREILKLRYGFGDGYTYTLEEVGRIFGIKRERVRQIEAKAIRKLQHPVRSGQLEPFLESYIE